MTDMEFDNALATTGVDDHTAPPKPPADDSWDEFLDRVGERFPGWEFTPYGDDIYIVDLEDGRSIKMEMYEGWEDRP